MNARRIFNKSFSPLTGIVFISTIARMDARQPEEEFQSPYGDCFYFYRQHDNSYYLFSHCFSPLTGIVFISTLLPATS